MDLKERLSAYPKEKIIALLVKAYKRDQDTRREVDKLLQSEKSSDDQLAELKADLESIGSRPAAFFKDKLEAYAKSEKDKRKRIEAYFLFVDAVLAAATKGTVDHRMIMVASSFYGKAIRMMDQTVWDEKKEQAFELSERFYRIPMDTAFQAVRYYQVAKDRFDVEEKG